MMTGTVEYINPDTMHKNPAYSQAVVVVGPSKTIYIGGQNSVDASGEIVGDDLATQTDQALKNVTTVLAAVGANLDHLIKLQILLVQGVDLREGFAAFQKHWGNRSNAPIVTVAFVAALGNPRFLVEIDGIAVVPQ